MARKRMIDPSLWTDDGMAELEPRQQLLYIGLFSNADDAGRIKGSAQAIRLMLPGVYAMVPNEEIEADLNAVLRSMTQLQRYQVDGRPYLVFVNYASWQKIDKPQASRIPSPEAADSPNDLGMVPEQSPNDQEPVAPNRKEKNRTEVKRKEQVASALPTRLRAPDLLFEQIVSECYAKSPRELTDDERGRVNKALPQLRKINATPEQVQARASEYRSRSPDYPLTPQTLTKCWTDLGTPRKEPSSGNRPHAVNGQSSSDPASQMGGGGNDSYTSGRFGHIVQRAASR